MMRTILAWYHAWVPLVVVDAHATEALQLLVALHLLS